MHQLVALFAFLVLTVGKTSQPGVGWSGQLAYVSGSALGHIAIFMALHVVVYYGAKLMRPKEVYASFTQTRLNWLTFGLLVYLVSVQLKR